MFDIAWSEFLVVAVVALVVVGPRDLPALLRTVGKTVASVRRMAGDFQQQFNEAMREAELDDLQREVTGLKESASKMMQTPDPIRMARDEIKGALDKSAAPSALAGSSKTARDEGADPVPSAFAPEPPDPPPPPTQSDFGVSDGALPAEPATAAPARPKPAATKANGAAKPEPAAVSEPVKSPAAPTAGAGS